MDSLMWSIFDHSKSFKIIQNSIFDEILGSETIDQTHWKSSRWEQWRIYWILHVAKFVRRFVDRCYHMLPQENAKRSCELSSLMTQVSEALFLLFKGQNEHEAQNRRNAQGLASFEGSPPHWEEFACFAQDCWPGKCTGLGRLGRNTKAALQGRSNQKTHR